MKTQCPAAPNAPCQTSTQIHQAGAPNTEKRDLVDQKIAARLQRIESYLLEHPELVATQGTLLATWRVYRGRRLGPYFQIAYRQAGRQRAIYVGRSEELAERVRRLLDRLQGLHRGRQVSKRLKAQVRASLRRTKDQLSGLLAVWGITLKGFEFRGVRRALAPPISLPSSAVALGKNPPFG